ncbi:heterokaryon incompatibility protein-domain-containing protein [Coniochaeta sp. 2T2.1]|nr:heterokaryon incompatibility protein-domain-containing protein [Coniochaeta sp. 2T2.1]
MRLVNTRTLELVDFIGDMGTCPRYAILSHTWSDDEVTYQDMTTDREAATLEKGYSKIVAACRQARRQADDVQYVDEPLDWIWIDTCCIDKSSRAELSEAINSMYLWYSHSNVCFAFLSDVHCRVDMAQFSGSRWFTRGSTLQELLAPATGAFYSSTWDIAQRMSWASRRETTPKEDIAYSLLGIFGVSMPLIYGEGGIKAFVRLQEEIMKDSSDQSIFAFGWGQEHSLAEIAAKHDPGPLSGLRSPSITMDRSGHTFYRRGREE